MKNGRPHLIPLCGPALAILKKRVRGGRDHVFGRGARGFQGWSWRRKDLDDRIVGPRPDWVLHDFRRPGRPRCTSSSESRRTSLSVCWRISGIRRHRRHLQPGGLHRREAPRVGALGCVRRCSGVRCAISEEKERRDCATARLKISGPSDAAKRRDGPNPANEVDPWRRLSLRLPHKYCLRMRWRASSRKYRSRTTRSN